MLFNFMLQSWKKLFLLLLSREMTHLRFWITARSLLCMCINLFVQNSTWKMYENSRKHWKYDRINISTNMNIHNFEFTPWKNRLNRKQFIFEVHPLLWRCLFFFFRVQLIQILITILKFSPLDEKLKEKNWNLSWLGWPETIKNVPLIWNCQSL